MKKRYWVYGYDGETIGGFNIRENAIECCKSDWEAACVWDNLNLEYIYDKRY